MANFSRLPSPRPVRPKTRHSRLLSSSPRLGRTGRLESLARVQQALHTSRGPGRQPPTTFRMTYTVFVRSIGTVYSDEEDENSVQIASDEIIKTAPVERLPRGQRIQRYHQRRKTQNPPLSSSEDSESDAIIQPIPHTTQVIPSTPPSTQISDQSASIATHASSYNDLLIPTGIA